MTKSNLYKKASIFGRIFIRGTSKRYKIFCFMFADLVTLINTNPLYILMKVEVFVRVNSSNFFFDAQSYYWFRLFINDGLVFRKIEKIYC